MKQYIVDHLQIKYFVVIRRLFAYWIQWLSEELMMNITRK